MREISGAAWGRAASGGNAGAKYQISLSLAWRRASRNAFSFPRETCSYNICSYTAWMVLELKLRKVGNSVGLVLPKEALARLNAGDGDAVFLTDTTDGGIRLTASNPEFARKMKAAESLSRRYRHPLRELAK
jgi:putative addiction module antidote